MKIESIIMCLNLILSEFSTKVFHILLNLFPITESPSIFISINTSKDFSITELIDMLTMMTKILGNLVFIVLYMFMGTVID